MRASGSDAPAATVSAPLAETKLMPVPEIVR
jgi:hypothetical protein